MKIRNLHTADQVAEALRVIKDCGPIKAIDLARRLDLGGNRETARRKVRAIVKRLRDNGGVMVIANLNDGYFLTEDKKLWQAYLEGKQVEAVHVLAATGKKIKTIKDSNGRGMLFAPGFSVGLA